ncbi:MULTISPECIES: MarR family winged helix-turn-helix transcriptional regulator [unclassified Crossiella]|uniref:MarR family winged helix-turn-helix transcriptional regulator n=1 Tax=unclassified Crossiella TaxID=2620835 RepID=UPI001FFEAA87|nr:MULTISPECIES: MarR family transcriptional regulator [unclassified Crossiella]MCK2237572.1 MarR family transcriptional regulator [Crossiella sp. S99.2]MCK2254858.1 MarR family transcriptional regulator [Crossiella sp. S99.1]
MGMPLDERLGGDIKRVEHELMGVKQAVLRPVGLTVAQYAALLVLSEQPGISAAELARRSRVTPQTMTTILRNLESAKLIERAPHELHRNVLETRLTEAGRTAFEQADKHASAVERRLAAEFTKAEQDTLRALLARCSAVLTAPDITG